MSFDSRLVDSLALPEKDQKIPWSENVSVTEVGGNTVFRNSRFETDPPP